MGLAWAAGWETLVGDPFLGLVGERCIGAGAGLGLTGLVLLLLALPLRLELEVGLERLYDVAVPQLLDRVDSEPPAGDAGHYYLAQLRCEVDHGPHQGGLVPICGRGFLGGLAALEATGPLNPTLNVPRHFSLLQGNDPHTFCGVR